MHRGVGVDEGGEGREEGRGKGREVVPRMVSLTRGVEGFLDKKGTRVK